MLHVQGLVTELDRSGLGFNLSFCKQREQTEQSLPRLMYADNIVLMIDKEDLHGLTDICGTKEAD